MPSKTVSVGELQDYWNYVDELKSGDIIERHVWTREMPAWAEICDILPWGSYRLGRFTEKDHGYCGVYRLVALAHEKVWLPARIQRLGGEDNTGTLYIGEAEWLSRRLNQLRRSCKGETTHGAGKMWRDCDLLQGRFPSSKLGIAILGTGLSTHRLIEADLIRAYLNSFGDTPPLNCSY
jgi:hypothetical protein